MEGAGFHDPCKEGTRPEGGVGLSIEPLARNDLDALAAPDGNCQHRRMQLDLENFLPYRLHRIAGVLSNRARDIYRRKHKLTVPEWRVLATLGQFGLLTAGDIGRHSAMHKTKVSRAVAALEQRRWLARETNEADRREAFLTLTRQGRRAYEEIVPDLTGFEDRLKKELGAAAAGELLSALARLEAVLLNTGKKGSGPQPRTGRG